MVNQRHVWLNPHEVAELTGKHRITVYRALNAGRLHGHRHPWLPRWMVHVSSAAAYQKLEVDTLAQCDCNDEYGRNARIRANDESYRHAPRRSRGSDFPNAS